MTVLNDEEIMTSLVAAWYPLTDAWRRTGPARPYSLQYPLLSVVANLPAPVPERTSTRAPARENPLSSETVVPTANGPASIVVSTLVDVNVRYCAVIVASPSSTPTTSPPLTRRTSGFDDVQVACAVTSMDEPSTR